MGNENVIKDPNIEIFLQLKSLVYKSGQQLKGCIYLQAKEYSSYSELILTLQCFEKTQLKNKKDKNGQPLTQERKTYYEKMKLAQFINGLYQGQHQFPFRIKLPQQLPGSLILTPNDYIRYILTAYIQSTSPIQTNQLHSRQIWIIEKFSSPIEPIFSKQQTEPKCCMFGYSWGWLKTQIQCEFNCVQPGQKVKLKFEINTLRMNSEVKYTKIRVMQKIFTATHQFSEQNEISELFSFDFNQASIKKGQIKKMEKLIVFSLDLLPTAIGQLLSRFYIIQAHLSFACYSQVKQNIHIFVASNKNLIIEENKPFTRPKYWKPQKYEKIQFNQLKKYQHKPHPRMSFYNIFKQENDKFERMKTILPETHRRINT